MNITKFFYISTGRKNGFYTLRTFVQSKFMCSENDYYIVNLATDMERAEEKAQQYVDAFIDRVGANKPNTPDGMQVVLLLGSDADVYKRVGKLSVKQSQQIEMIENGYVPFGKFEGKKIVDMTPSYILYFADMAKNEEDKKPVFRAFVEACLGIALEKEYIAKRQAIIEARMEERRRSSWIGEVGQRLVLEGEIVYTKEWDDIYGYCYMTVFKSGDDSICYTGSKSLGEKGQTIKIKATVKKHVEKDGAKMTIIQRPAVV